MNAILMGSPQKIENVYSCGRLERIASLTELYPAVVPAEQIEKDPGRFKEVRYIFSTWGMPALTSEQIKLLPNLESVFYAAGSVQKFARPFLNKNIKIISAWAANAVPVAEYTLSQILLGCKCFFQQEQTCRSSGKRRGIHPAAPGIFSEKIALIGAGMIGRNVIELLKPFALDVLVVDPFLSDEKANEIGATKVTLEEAFQQAFVVSNHLPNLPSTQGLIQKKHFASMRENATFINTGRGAQVVEADMIEVFQKRTDLIALLDVTYPEPPEDNSPLYTLPNILLTPHIAGSLGNEVVRMADYVIDECERLLSGKKLHYEVSLKMLDTMA